jgi:AcrR family transcriptional regulator
MRRDQLLDAAEALLAEAGTRALTLAAVAQRAGVSKGGLLYHFATKKTLVAALVERLITEFDEAVGRYDDGTPAGHARAYVQATFDALAAAPQSQRRWAAVIAAATDAHMLEPLRQALRRWHRRDADPVESRIARLAADGLWENVVLDPGLFDAADLEAVRLRLVEMTRC